jgi:hypothetical protein
VRKGTGGEDARWRVVGVRSRRALTPATTMREVLPRTSTRRSARRYDGSQAPLACFSGPKACEYRPLRGRRPARRAARGPRAFSHSPILGGSDAPSAALLQSPRSRQALRRRLRHFSFHPASASSAGLISKYISATATAAINSLAVTAPRMRTGSLFRGCRGLRYQPRVGAIAVTTSMPMATCPRTFRGALPVSLSPEAVRP